MSEPEIARTETGGGFAVEVPGFAGPFRLLADLVLEQKVDVCDVPIATVTDRFLAYTKDAERWNLEEATWFLAICAILLELKLARLTPRRVEPDEEDIVGGSPDLLYARSLELRAFRKVAVDLARRLEDEAGYSARDVGPGPEFSRLYPDPLAAVTAADLAPLHGVGGDDGRAGALRLLRRQASVVPRAGRGLRRPDPCGGPFPRDPRAVP